MTCQWRLSVATVRLGYWVSCLQRRRAPDGHHREWPAGSCRGPSFQERWTPADSRWFASGWNRLARTLGFRVLDGSGSFPDVSDAARSCTRCSPSPVETFPPEAVVRGFSEVWSLPWPCSSLHWWQLQPDCYCWCCAFYHRAPPSEISVEAGLWATLSAYPCSLEGRPSPRPTWLAVATPGRTDSGDWTSPSGPDPVGSSAQCSRSPGRPFWLRTPPSCASAVRSPVPVSRLPRSVPRVVVPGRLLRFRCPIGLCDRGPFRSDWMPSLTASRWTIIEGRKTERANRMRPRASKVASRFGRQSAAWLLRDLDVCRGETIWRDDLQTVCMSGQRSVGLGHVMIERSADVAEGIERIPITSALMITLIIIFVS